MDFRLDEPERKALLATARESIASRLEKRAASWPCAAGALLMPGGVFVTLHENSSLRGCIGRMSSPAPLVETVREMARAAAFEDPRFPALEHDDLDLMDIEITVLSPLRRIQDPNEIVVGLHGIYIVKGWRSGVLLPQVAAEQGWDRGTFLEQTCWKAGLPPDAWEGPDASISIFEGLVFGENAGE
ncbi:MAG: AmmeMemoRadiSam system protein A [Rectinemataceae bacterium]